MAIKLLTKQGVEVTNIDDARAYNFDAGMRSGIIKGAFNEGNIFYSGNVVSLEPCELRIYGHRIVINETWSYTFSNAPTSLKKYSLIAQVEVTDNDVIFSLFVQGYNASLIQENLYSNENGKGIYQIEIANFDLNIDGNITNLIKTIKVLNNGVTNAYVNNQLVDNLTFETDPQTQINEIKVTLENILNRINSL